MPRINPGSFPTQTVSAAIPPSAYKEPVRCATTGPINLATEGLSSPDGIATPLLDGEHVVVAFQTLQEENGIYDAHAGAWTRRADFDAPADKIPGAVVAISEGTLFGNHLFLCTTDSPVTIGTTPINFVDIGSVGGGVTSVGLSAPGEFTVSGSPVTSLGTLGLSWATQTTNKVLAAPNGSTGVPTFRTLVAADIPTIPLSGTSGTLGVTRGGTGNTAAPANGELLIGNGTGFSLAGLTAGTGITITPGAGTITIDATGSGSVTSVGLALPVSLFNVTNSPVTGTGTLTGALIVQQANKVWSGPTTGADAVPTFRSLVEDDLPNGIGYPKLALTNSVVVADIAAGAKSTTPTNSTLVLRDGSGNFTVNTPTAAGQPVTKAYVDAVYDIGGGSNGLVGVSAYILNFVATRSIQLPSNFTGSYAKAQVAATALTTFTIYKNGGSIGTLSFAASASVGTFSVLASVSFAPGDVLTIQGPVIPDTTLSDLAVTLLASMV